ncbi:MAG TPA: putative aminohydrolase SsnA [Candidatus Acidoferrales bacterium]|nr:putative aminohydrolase SsnA [Candidatus Acidoferrales bacterium]
MILSNARIVTLDGENRILDSGSIEIAPDGTVRQVSDLLERSGQDLGGRLVMPALINCHTHLYSTLARGLSLSGRAPENFPSILKKLWWRLDCALNEEDIYYSALVGLIDSAKCGVGTLIDHHSSPNACPGSLDWIAQAFQEVGLRGATCYETSDRNGARAAREAIRENVRYLEHIPAGAQVGGMFGLHASFTLGDRTLRACLEANQALRAGFHVHVAEDRCDRGAARRLCRLGVLDDKSIAAHCVHVTPAERATLGRRGVNVVHNPQSNCNNAVGIADLHALSQDSVRVGLGSDGFSARMWDEFKTACHLQKLRAHTPRAAFDEAFAAAFPHNRDIVKGILGVSIGTIEPGAKADLLVLDYRPPTPIHSGNLAGHLMFGISNAPVESLMVNGRWIVREGRCVAIDEQQIAERAAARAKALWERL